MRLIARNRFEYRQRAFGTLFAVFVVAWLAINQCDLADGQGTNQPQWNPAQASDTVWGQSDPGAKFDANVRPADFRSAGVGPVQSVPPVDFATQNGNEEIREIASAGSSMSTNIEFDLASVDSPGQPDWSARFRELLRSQAGSINWTRMLGSLAIVVGGWFLVTWLFRHVSPRTNGRLPASVFELVGSARLNSRQNLQVIRVGSRLLMLIVSPEGAQAVGEISHPGEVDSLVAECESGGIRRSHRSRSGIGAAASAGITGSGRDTSALLEQLVKSLQKPDGKKTARTEFEV